MESIIRILICSMGGLLAGFLSRLWIRRLYEKRSLAYEVSRKTEIIFLVVLSLSGAVIGLLTKGIADAVFTLLLLTILATVFMTDWTYRVIPNPTVLAVLGLKFLAIIAAAIGIRNLPETRFLPSLLGFVVCFIVFSLPRLYGKKVGAGDVKLAAAIGFLLGTYGSLISIVIMGLLIFTYSMVQRRLPVLTFLKTNIPMGPFIALGTVMTCLIMTYTAV